MQESQEALNMNMLFGGSQEASCPGKSDSFEKPEDACLEVKPIDTKDCDWNSLWSTLLNLIIKYAVCLGHMIITETSCQSRMPMSLQWLTFGDSNRLYSLQTVCIPWL